jgi:hypothetical protein
MWVALASRLALGAVAPAEASPTADALTKLQAAMMICGGDRDAPSPPRHTSPPLGDLLLADQSDNGHALASEPPPHTGRLAIATGIRLAWQATGAFPMPRHRAFAARGPPPLS